MTDHAPFVAVMRDEGQHTVHRFPAFEQCNLDDAAKKVYVDQAQADELVASDKARWCETCRPLAGVV